jgi:predicted helicase
VKFLRFAQWKIEQAGRGVVGMITNHGYLDNPTFRGMRQQLMQAFTDIYILDLHGNSKKKETAPDGSKDENVFDIQQGVCIGIFVKEPGKTGPACVHHADVYGSRQDKYKYLLSNDVSSVHWTEFSPQLPSNLFVPQDAIRSAEVQRFWRLPDIMNLNGDPAPGIVTTHDEFAISWSQEEAAEKVSQLLATKSEDEARTLFRLCSQAQWSYTQAKHELSRGGWHGDLSPILYRPFDERWTVYNQFVAVHRRTRAMDHMRSKGSLAFVMPRRVEVAGPWQHVLVATSLVDHVAVSSKTVDYALPLYLFPVALKGKQQMLGETETSPWPAGKDGRRPNLSPKFVAEMEAKLGLKFVPEGAEGSLECGSEAAALSSSRSTGKAGAALPQSKGVFTPEDVFDYIYAIFHSPTYRKRYAEFLKIDFPRVPLTSDKKLFWKLVALGRELVALHLLESPKVNDLVTKYPKKGSDTVGQVRYVEPDSEAVSRKPSAVSGRVYINDEQYFEGVKPEWFEFHIGGYQVLHKWLKDRKGRKLSNDDITHYQRVVVATKETIRLMSEIDQAIPKWPIE